MAITPPFRTWGHDELICRRLNADGDEATIMFRRAGGGIDDSYQVRVGTQTLTTGDPGTVALTTGDPDEAAREISRLGYTSHPPKPVGHPHLPDWADKRLARQ